ncbi:MAG: hypothetical protein Q9M43_07120 [Sulfurimonas sp.]|nr:hypothetical protein [Sulfurimonas sp.]
MSKNIYNIYREYMNQPTPTDKSKYIISLSHEIRKTLESLSTYVENEDRFESIYDGWIDNLDHEFVVLNVYSIILNTRRNLNKFCVNDKKYKEFTSHKKKMLFLLLENKQYEHASSLLDVYMFSKDFEEKKLENLRDEVLSHLQEKKMLLPKKLINEIYQWVDALKLPSYLATDIDGDFKFSITNDVPSIETLKEDVEKALNESIDLHKIVDSLVEKNSVQ